MESASQCSSGCQSGWTLYLELSNGHQHHFFSSLPHKPFESQMLQQAESGEEDSMVSDASSGPPPHPHEQDELQDHKLQQRQFLGDHCYSSSGRRSSASGPSSGCLGSTRTRSLSEVKSKKRRGAAAQGEEARPRYDDDDLDDTASSSAVFSCPMRDEYAAIDAAEAVRRGGDLMGLQNCAFSAKRLQFAAGGMASGSRHEHAGLCNSTP